MPGDNGFPAANVDSTVEELFRGRLPIAEAVEQLRKRLLDLSTRNRLLNYRFPRQRSIRFVDRPALDLLFERMLDAKNVNIRFVEEPRAAEYEGGRRPEVVQYASKNGIDTNYEFSPSQPNDSSQRRTPSLQALFYPAELETRLRKIASEARTVIEETGTNMLYLVFGFLEYFESDESDRVLLAPLLSVPVVLNRGEIDPEARCYRYTIAHSGEDIAENQTLREKLKNEFRLNLPDLGDDDTPTSYLLKIEKAVRSRPRWKVSRQLALGFLSFGKLAIWADLDPKKWLSLVDHPVLKSVFEGGDSTRDLVRTAEACLVPNSFALGEFRE